jgi:CRISPR-associated protein Csb2
MLSLDIELLTGVYRAAVVDRSAPEWPPHPERALSALAQAWGDGGGDPGERAALEWLESLDPPDIEADSMPAISFRDAPTVFVPPNDTRGDKPEVLPDRRPRKERTFHVVAPSEPRVAIRWSASADKPVLDALTRLATRVACLGHSSSLVRFKFSDGAEGPPDRTWRPDEDGATSVRTPHSGRLSHLVEWHAAGERPFSGRSTRYHPPRPEITAPIPSSVLGGSSDWFIFEGAGGFAPDLLAFAHVARRVRNALMKLGPQPPPEVVSGHLSDGSPSQSPHIAIVPLADVGWDHSRGDLLGFAIVLPRRLEGEPREQVLASIAAYARIHETPDDGDHLIVPLRIARDQVWNVERAAAPSRSSLKPGRWCLPSRVWASATPVVLNRYADNNDPCEEAGTIAAACRHIGLPDPEEIQIHKHSAVRAAPSAYPARGSRSRPDWSFPAESRWRERPRRHVVLRFSNPVAGPVIIGAGRYHGFGLCLPVTDEDAQ